ncbi:MAG: phage tail tip lysozyme [Saccharofermentanales bacterium]|jgi:hypothetical protein
MDKDDKNNLFQNKKDTDKKDYQQKVDSLFLSEQKDISCTEKMSEKTKISDEKQSVNSDRSEIIKKQRELLIKQIEEIKRKREKEFSNKLLGTQDVFSLDVTNTENPTVVNPEIEDEDGSIKIINIRNKDGNADNSKNYVFENNSKRSDDSYKRRIEQKNKKHNSNERYYKDKSLNSDTQSNINLDNDTSCNIISDDNTKSNIKLKNDDKKTNDFLFHPVKAPDVQVKPNKQDSNIVHNNENRKNVLINKNRRVLGTGRKKAISVSKKEDLKTDLNEKISSSNKNYPAILVKRKKLRDIKKKQNSNLVLNNENRRNVRINKNRLVLNKRSKKANASFKVVKIYPQQFTEKKKIETNKKISLRDYDKKQINTYEDRIKPQIIESKPTENYDIKKAELSYKLRIKKTKTKKTKNNAEKENSPKAKISQEKSNINKHKKANKNFATKTKNKLSKVGQNIKKTTSTISNTANLNNKDTQQLAEESATPAIVLGKGLVKKAVKTIRKVAVKIAQLLVKGLIKLITTVVKALGPIGIAIFAVAIIIVIAISAVAQYQPTRKLLDVLNEDFNIEEALKDPDFKAIRELSMRHKETIEEIIANNEHDSLVLTTGYGIPELHQIYLALIYNPNGDFKNELEKFYENNVNIKYEITTKEITNIIPSDPDDSNSEEDENDKENTKTVVTVHKTLTITTEVMLPNFDTSMVPDGNENMLLLKEAIYKIAGIDATSNRPILAGSTEAIVWFFLLENGFSKESIAGIMGNIYAESRFKTDTIEQTATNPGEGIGLIQWSFDRKQQFLSMAEARGADWKDLNIQLEFLLHELTYSQKYRFNKMSLPYPAPYNYFGLDGGINEFKSLKDISLATEVFCWNFESPNYDLANYPTREAKAYEYYNTFKDYKDRADYGGMYADQYVQALFAEAEKHLGKPYIYGANGPNAFDCSSFVCWAFTNSGVVNMPRTSAQGVFDSYCDYISPEEARAGDLVFFERTYASANRISHVGIYAGNNQMIHAGSPIEYTDLTLDYYREHFYCFGRVKNGLINPNSRSLQWPVPSSKNIASHFGPRSWEGYSDFHTGTDIAAPTGTPVIAPASGTVTHVGWIDINGNTVKIDHGNGLITMYCHLSGFNCIVGQRVNAGDIICYIGSTGFSTGPHLHYEIQVDGKSVDPMTYY